MRMYDEAFSSRSGLKPIECLTEIVENVLGRLDPDAEPDQIGWDLEFGPGSGCVGHHAGVLDQGLDGTERFGEREHLRRGGEPHCGIGAAGDSERHHSTEVLHLPRSGVVPGMIGQARVEHVGDLVVALQELDDGTGVLAVAVHPHGERLEPRSVR